MGRKKLPIDPEQVRKLAVLGCSLREMGAILGCDHTTIHKRFSTEIELGDARGKIAIRRWQMKRAKAGSDTMLIHLGMDRLEQKTKADVTSAGKAIATFQAIDDGRDPDLPPPAEAAPVCD